jgi:hypothetical protein
MLGKCMVTRTLPEGSWVEIDNQKKRLNTELRARAYFYEKRGYIVSAVSGIAETGEPTILPADVANSDLGRCVCDRLLEFTPRSPGGMRQMKLRDWPAYQASGAKSVKSFEANCWMITVDTINTAIVITTRPSLSLHSEISVEGTTIPRHEDLGAVIRKTLKAAMVLRARPEFS